MSEDIYSYEPADSLFSSGDDVFTADLNLDFDQSFYEASIDSDVMDFFTFDDFDFSSSNTFDTDLGSLGSFGSLSGGTTDLGVTMSPLSLLGGSDFSSGGDSFTVDLDPIDTLDDTGERGDPATGGFSANFDLGPDGQRIYDTPAPPITPVPAPVQITGTDLPEKPIEESEPWYKKFDLDMAEFGLKAIGTIATLFAAKANADAKQKAHEAEMSEMMRQFEETLAFKKHELAASNTNRLELQRLVNQGRIDVLENRRGEAVDRAEYTDFS